MTDKDIRAFYEQVLSDSINWRELNGFEYLYCEDEVYLLRDVHSKTVHLVTATSPLKAVNKLGGGMVFNCKQYGKNCTVITNLETMNIDF